ncbi:carboxylesterase family protein [Vibrio ulleungensis]|uniref:Carboxylesterase family protein n=1 Tax=Vibrio ulleungensis TaxID=2807619 RepID=A0ABS2HCJ8_9VIBR|nr:carboxylesterase family protein [Vibrio ulleungensis]MBM7035313.1 carboxylesterase family protein [Vibrio ulleungensis]
MTLFTRTLTALAIVATISGCNTEVDPTVPLPSYPDPIKPGPSVEFSTQIAGLNVTGMIDSVVISDLEGNQKLASVESFKGIQYAEQARFEHSTLVDDYADGVDATQFGDSCPQQEEMTTQQTSEDCLYLNIWRPQGTLEHEELPVYVFIHGGDFEYGSGSEPLIQGDTVVAQGDDDGKGFVYVSFNYRLGLLGSYRGKGDDISTNGNFGLGDQMRALEWVNKHIGQFGGNANNITVVGQGSGAMSVGILQGEMERESNSRDYHFSNAIMQSNPYGYEYKDDTAAENFRSSICSAFDMSVPVVGGCNPLKNIDKVLKSTDSTDLDTLLEGQASLLSPVNTLVRWLTDNISIGDDSVTSTPMHHLMPFAPYIEIEEGQDENETSNNVLFTEQPLQKGFTVPTALGNNANESNTFGMLPSLTFLIPVIICEVEPSLCGEEEESFTSSDLDQFADALAQWSTPENITALEHQIAAMNKEEITSKSIELPESAYEAITTLFFGRSNATGSERLLRLADYYPESESDLGGALANMSMFKMMLNDMLFTGPARKVTQDATEDAILYYFDVKPSFNVWGSPAGNGSIIKEVACILGSCNGSELPFVFNKAYRLDGSPMNPSSKEAALMNRMSRLWFSPELFKDTQYYRSNGNDNVLVIDINDGFIPQSDWDKTTNPGVDPVLRNGRLTGLDSIGLLLGYIH